MSADRVSAALLLVFAAFVIVEARALPYWTGSAPGPGFVPFWLGVLLAFASVAMFRIVRLHSAWRSSWASPPPRQR
jgi:hypothetical protein